MAAAEYFNPGPPQGPPQNQQYRPPTLAPPTPSSLPYPLSDAPPPYSSLVNQERPSSQPPPQQRPPPPQQAYSSNAGAYQPYQPAHPPPTNGETHAYPPEKLPQRPSLQNAYRPSDYTTQFPGPPPPPAPPVQHPQPQPQPPQPQNGFVRPGLSSLNYPGKEVRFNTQRPSSQPAPVIGYEKPQRYRSPSRSRSRSRSRERRSRRQHTHHNNGGSYRGGEERGYVKPHPQKKSSSASTFLGAGGGALIGDMIFPGLGTLGGAILGGVGGHEYSKEKGKSRGGGNARSYSHGDYYEDDYRRGRR